MIITPHNEDGATVLFTVDYGNGKIEEIKERGKIMGILGYRALLWIGAYHPYYTDKLPTLRKTVGRKFNELQDFEGLINNPNFSDIKLNLDGWKALSLTILKKLDPLIRKHTQLEEGTAPQSVPEYVYEVIRWCSSNLSDSWEPDYGHRDNKMYDFEGIKKEATALRSLDDRRIFLEKILREMAVPFAAKLARRCDFYPPDTTGVIGPEWHIAVLYRHALSPSERDTLRKMYKELEQTHEDQLKHAFFTVGVEKSEGKNVVTSHSLSSSDIPQLQWEGTQTDLVFIMDCLKEAGFLAATDAEVTRHFSYGGTARDKAKTYRDLRKKIKEGQAYADSTRVAKLIELLNSSPR